MKLEGLDHPKTYQFAELLNIKRVAAIGHLELFFAFVSKKAPAGNVGKWPNGSIARACDWEEGGDKFVNALINSGFLEYDEKHRLIVHDWDEHMPSWVRSKLKREGKILVNKNIIENDLDKNNSNDDYSNDCSSDYSQDYSADYSKDYSNDSSADYKPSQAKPREAKPSQAKPREAKPVAQKSQAPLHTFSKPEILQVFQKWQQEHNQSDAVLDYEREKIIKNALQTHGMQKVLEAITGITKSPFHMGKNSTGELYFDLGIILKNAKNIEKFARYCTDPPKAPAEENYQAPWEKAEEERKRKRNEEFLKMIENKTEDDTLDTS